MHVADTLVSVQMQQIRGSFGAVTCSRFVVHCFRAFQHHRSFSDSETVLLADNDSPNRDDDFTIA